MQGLFIFIHTHGVMAMYKKVLYGSFVGIVVVLAGSFLYGMQRVAPVGRTEQPEPLRKAYEALSHIPRGCCASEMRSALDYFATIWPHRSMKAGNILHAVSNLIYADHILKLITSDEYAVLLDGDHYAPVFERVLKFIERVDRKDQAALVRYAVYLIFAEQ